MKNMIIKLKKEIEELKEKSTQHQQVEINSNQRIQDLSMEIDELKMQVSETVRQKEKQQADVSWIKQEILFKGILKKFEFSEKS